MATENNYLDNLDLSGKSNSNNFDYLDIETLQKNAATIKKNTGIEIMQIKSKKELRKIFREKFVDNNKNLALIKKASDVAIIEKFGCIVSNPLVFRNK